MNIILLGIIVILAFLIQYILTFFQMKSFTKVYKELRSQGRVAIGRKKGGFNAGSIVMFSIDESGIILKGNYIQGVTVLARFRKLNGFEGRSLERIDQEFLKQFKLGNPLKKAILDGVSNYKTIMKGEEVKTPPSPFQKVGNFFTEKKEKSFNHQKLSQNKLGGRLWKQ